MRVVSILLCLVASAVAFSPHPFQTSTPRHQSSLQMDAETTFPVVIMLAAMAASIVKAPTTDDVFSPDAIAMTTSRTVAATPVLASVSVVAEPAAFEAAESPVAVVQVEETLPKSRKAVRVLKKIVAPWRKWENIQ